MVKNSRREKMGKKYLDTKEGSLEQSILGLWEKAAVKQEKLVGGQKKLDKDKDGDIDGKDFAMLRKSKKKDKKEEVELDEKAAKYLEIEFKDTTTAEKAYNHINNKIEPGGSQPWDDFNQEGSSIQFDNMRDADGLMKELKKKFKFKVYEREEVQVKEGKMKDLSMKIDDIVAKMKKDKNMKGFADKFKKDAMKSMDIEKSLEKVLPDYIAGKEIQKLMAGHMPESYEIGTDEYRKHTENVTPGEDGEWVDAVKKKNESMREALAKVWNTTEDKNPFKKESKKDLTKEVKDGKTMTGKKVASVDVNPKIMEKKK